MTRVVRIPRFFSGGFLVVPHFADLPVLIQIVLLISAVLILLICAGLIWRMVKALFAKKDRD